MEGTVAFDIETEGLLATCQVTSYALYSDESATVVLNTDGREADASRLEEHTQLELGINTDVIVYDKEKQLLGDLSSRKENYGTFLMFHGKTWKGGFDTRFLATRCVMNDVPWILEGTRMMELQETIESLFWTKAERPDRISPSNNKERKSLLRHLGYVDDDIPSYKNDLESLIDEADPDVDDLVEWAEDNGYDIPDSSLGSLDDLHDFMCGGYEWDPCEDSELEVWEEWEEGNWESVILHNLCDVVKTYDLYETIEVGGFGSGKDRSMYTL